MTAERVMVGGLLLEMVFAVTPVHTLAFLSLFVSGIALFVCVCLDIKESRLRKQHLADCDIMTSWSNGISSPPGTARLPSRLSVWPIKADARVLGLR